MKYLGRVNELAQECHDTARRKGFWDRPNQVDGEQLDPFDVHIALAKLALVHTEVSEACEAIRKPHDPDENLSEELADIVIRVFDFAVARGIEIEGAIVAKMDRNKGREYMHGKEA
jgi:NTP pyrophosphatase (non-canonical NTP hydrolase)